MRKVSWTHAAGRDLTNIREYLAQVHPAIAQETIDRLILGARWLLDVPSAGEIVGYRQWRKWRPRRTQYLLIYAPGADGISIVRVFHVQQDWQAVVD